jgi:tetratricopeptide (TPR) repeat protein
MRQVVTLLTQVAKSSLLILMVLLFATPPLRAQDQPQDTASLLRSAAEAISAGDFNRAESEAQAILAADSKEYRAVNLLGVIRAQQHRDQEAEQLFKSVIEHRPDMASAHVNLGMLYERLLRDDEALTQFQEALRAEPGKHDAVLALTNLLRSQARAAAIAEPEKALSLLMKAREISPENPDIAYEFGTVSLRMSLYKDAAQSFQRALELRKDDPAALYGLGRAQIGLTAYQDARQTFEHYLELRPNDASGHYGYGLALAPLQLNREARAEFETSIRLQPVQTESYFQLGMLQLESQELDAASANLEKVLSRDPRHAGALTGLGRVNFEKKNYAAAAELLRKAVSSAPGQRQSHYYLGLTYARLGKKQESEDELQTATRLEHEEAEKQRLGLKIMNPNQH